mgnify:CR=1 FL=1|jgi:uncharacterized membrane protein (UPF0127 family)
MKYVQVVNTKNNTVLADKVGVADTFLLRLKGLLGRKSLEAGEGLVFYPCSSIHCYGMKFAIDAIFLDENKKVLALYSWLEPGQTAKVPRAKYVLELGAGSACFDVEIGDILEF